MDEPRTPFVRLCGTRSVLVGRGLYLGHILCHNWQIVVNLLPHLSGCGVAFESVCHIFFCLCATFEVYKVPQFWNIYESDLATLHCAHHPHLWLLSALSWNPYRKVTYQCHLSWPFVM